MTRPLLATALSVLLFGCAEKSGEQLYQEYLAANRDSLLYVKLSGEIKQHPDFGVDYSKLPDFAAIEDTQARKKAFFDYMRPAVEFRNEVNAERRVLLGAVAIRVEHGLTLSQSDQHFLEMMRERYRVDEKLDDAEAVAELERRMDTLPESLVLAQAAIESGWGTSRFARQANNIFGEWCFTEGCGVVPERRSERASYEVRKFDTVDESIASYFRNLNSHAAYKPLRELRQQAREEDEDISGTQIAAGLERYSQRGHAYIEEVRRVIRGNGLEGRG